MTTTGNQEAKKATVALVKVVNSTGFPLQLGIIRRVEETVGAHGWRVLSTEHPWENQHTETTGYADIILQSCCESQMMIVECKRMLDADWIFLCPSAKAGQEPKKWQVARAWVTQIDNGNPLRFGWDAMTIEPIGYRSEFCGIPKMDNKATTMLERIGSELIDATEGIAWQDSELLRPARTALSRTFVRAYHPVIVTSAPLQVCKFSTNDISNNGEITACEFEEVPYLRFHKCLGGRLIDASESSNLREVLQTHERTVHVVNASYLVDFLTAWEYAFPFELRGGRQYR